MSNRNIYLASFLRPAGSKRPQGAERLNVHPKTISKIRRDIRV